LVARRTEIQDQIFNAVGLKPAAFLLNGYELARQNDQLTPMEK